MGKVGYEFNCPACAKPIKGMRGEKEFQCKGCTRSFSVSFAYPDLEAAFIAGELKPDIIPRAPGPVEDRFPHGLFNFLGRKIGGR